MTLIMNEQELMLSQIKTFEQKTGYSLKVKDGKPYYRGWLLCNSDYLPDNLVIDGNFNCSVDSIRLPKGLKVNGYLCISRTNITEIPNDCEFDTLYMEYAKVNKLRDNMMLFSLSAKKSALTELPKGLKIRDTLDISYTKITEIPDDCEFGSLYIENTKINKLRDNMNLNCLNVRNSLLQELPKGLKVKNYLGISYTDITGIPDDCEFGSLSMIHTKITKLRDNLVLGNFIAYNSSLTELPKGLVVMGDLEIFHTNITEIPNDCWANAIQCSFELNDERYEKKIEGTLHYKLKNEIVHISHPSGREFLHVDDIFSEVIEKKGNVYHARNGVNGQNFYVVTDGNEHWAHGNTLDGAKQDLFYKISVRDKSEYEKLTLDSVLSYDEAIACYRVITGACKLGTNDYLEHRLPEPKKKKKYTIGEMIELTKSEYGGRTFREFFEKK